MKAHPKHLGRVAVLALALAAAAAHGAPPAGRLLASQCAQCHGTNGQAVAGMEKLAGESESEIYGELIKMKASIKPDEIMHRQAAGYSDVTILEKGCDNFWHATGTKGGQSGNIVLSPTGEVMPEGY